MLPGTPLATIDPNQALPESARNILLGRYPQLSEDLLKQEIASIAKLASDIQYKIYTQIPGVKDGDKMRAVNHNNLLDYVAIDLSMLYSRILLLQQLLTKLQNLSTYGSNDIRSQLQILDTKARYLVAIYNSNSLFGALILSDKVTADNVDNTNIEAVGDGGVTLSFDETLYNDYYKVQSVTITRPDDLYGYTAIGADPTTDYSIGSYSCFKKGMAHGVWFEDMYTAVPYSDGIEYSVLLTFRQPVQINGIYYSLIDRAKNKVVRIEAELKEKVGWWTASCGSMVYDVDKGWQSIGADPNDLTITNFRQEALLTGVTTYRCSDVNVSSLRLVIRNYDYDYTILDEISQLTFIPTTKAEVLSSTPKLTSSKFARYKAGAYYIAPYYRESLATTGTFISHTAGTGFKPSSVYANHLVLFAEGQRLAQEQLSYKLAFKRNEGIVTKEVELGQPGYMCYKYEDGKQCGFAPEKSTEPIIHLESASDTKISTTIVIPDISPYIDYAYWFDSTSPGKWRQINPDGTPFTDTTKDAETVIPIPSTTPLELIPGKLQITFGIEEAGASPDKLVDTDDTFVFTCSYRSNVQRTLYYKFVGKDKTTGLAVSEEGKLGDISFFGTGYATHTVNLSFTVKNARGTLEVYANI